MRFFLVNDISTPVTTGQIMVGLHDFLKNEDHVVALCVGRDNAGNSNSILRFNTNLDVYLHVLLARLTGLQGYFSTRKTKKLIRKLREFKPDAVILGDIHGYYINMPMFLHELKKKQILTYWYMFDEYAFLGKCPYNKDCEMYLTECEKCPQVHEYPKSLFFDTSRKIFNDKLKLYTGFRTLSLIGHPFTVEKEKKSALVKKSGIRLLDYGWGIDTNSVFVPHKVEELRNELKIPHDNVVILAVAPYSNVRKGIKQYYYPLAEKLKDKNITFVHVGFDGNKGDAPENVITIPFVKDQQLLSDYFALADLFVLTSVNEGMPTVCIDSLCCGTPICGFNAEGIPYIAPAPFGTYTAQSVEAMAEVVAKAQKKTKSISDACRKYAVERFERNIIYKKLLAQIENDIQESKA